MCQLGSSEKLLQVPKSKPIIAYRCWTTNASDAEFWNEPVNLESISQTHDWHAGINVVNEKPTLYTGHDYYYGSTSGFYAYRTKAAAIADCMHTGTVLGKVELFGQVVKHEDGYRAEKIRIVELQQFGSEIKPAIRNKLVDRYTGKKVNAKNRKRAVAAPRSTRASKRAK